jgi:hypothetical protein
MSSMDNKNDTTRRAFFQEVTTGTAAVAVATALAQLGAPAAVLSQEKEAPSPMAGMGKMPPWPKGTEGTKYDHLFCTRFKEQSTTPVVEGPQAYFRGASMLPGAGINMGWQKFVKPVKLELQSHHHDVDEYLIFLGAELPDLVGTFDGELEIFLGEEYERHIITKATILYIPAGIEHNPMDIRKLNKPMMLSALHLAPYFNGKYQASGYVELKSMGKATE